MFKWAQKSAAFKFVTVIVYEFYSAIIFDVGTVHRNHKPIMQLRYNCFRKKNVGSKSVYVRLNIIKHDFALYFPAQLMFNTEITL